MSKKHPLRENYERYFGTLGPGFENKSKLKTEDASEEALANLDARLEHIGLMGWFRDVKKLETAIEEGLFGDGEINSEELVSTLDSYREQLRDIIQELEADLY